MQTIKALTFDLDDTLWPVAPVIANAEQIAFEWLEDNFPDLTATVGPEQLRQLRMEIMESHPEIRHDLTQVRARSLDLAFKRSGVVHTQKSVADAMAVFLKARNAISPYADTVEGLTRLAARYPLMAVSNGNADIEQTSLARFFMASTSAIDAGYAKPDRRIFMLAVERLGVEADEVLHIGDHPEQDILGAMDAGLKSMWMIRDGTDWPHPNRPDFEVSNLIQAADLLNA